MVQRERTQASLKSVHKMLKNNLKTSLWLPTESFKEIEGFCVEDAQSG